MSGVLISFNILKHTISLLMTDKFIRKMQFFLTLMFFRLIWEYICSYYFLSVIYLKINSIHGRHKCQLLLVLNTFIRNKSCSVKVAIPKDLFQKMVTCYFLIIL